MQQHQSDITHAVPRGHEHEATSRINGTHPVPHVPVQEADRA
jgi:hypothetical protein